LAHESSRSQYLAHREREHRPERGVVPEPLAVGAANPLVAVDVGGLLSGQIELVLPRADLGRAAHAWIGRVVVHGKSRSGGGEQSPRGECDGENPLARERRLGHANRGGVGEHRLLLRIAMLFAYTTKERTAVFPVRGGGDVRGVTAATQRAVM